jgi:hypothetical protein
MTVTRYQQAAEGMVMKVAQVDFEQSTLPDLTVGYGFLLNMPQTRTC